MEPDYITTMHVHGRTLDIIRYMLIKALSCSYMNMNQSELHVDRGVQVQAVLITCM